MSCVASSSLYYLIIGNCTNVVLLFGDPVTKTSPSLNHLTAFLLMALKTDSDGTWDYIRTLPHVTVNPVVLQKIPPEIPNLPIQDISYIKRLKETTNIFSWKVPHNEHKLPRMKVSEFNTDFRLMKKITRSMTGRKRRDMMDKDHQDENETENPVLQII